MATLKSLSALFERALYRIPDYQRGYAWGTDQLDDLWTDLINLEGDRKHYTGVLTLKEVPASEVARESPEHWLVEDGYRLYQVIDGQQRLTTCMILVQCIIDQVRAYYREHDPSKTDETIGFCNKSLKDHVWAFLLERHFNGVITTYKFGYEKDDPSYEYYRYRILNEQPGGHVQETFYTLNLGNARTYFDGQLKELVSSAGDLSPLEEIFRKLTVRLLFNPYEIPADFDEFVAFETMNNRGKKLSHLELLKNRLIYLSTLYPDDDVTVADRSGLRRAINESWAQVYFQLGRHKTKPLNDDDFLKAHWILFFRYTRKKGDDFTQFLLNRHFTSRNVLTRIPSRVELEAVAEVMEETDVEMDHEVEDEGPTESAIPAREIRAYVDDLRATAHGWFVSHFPHLETGLSPELVEWVMKLNRMPMFFGRPLVTAILLRRDFTEAMKLEALKCLERYFFLRFRLSYTKANVGDSEFYVLARAIHNGEKGLADLKAVVEEELSDLFEDGIFKWHMFDDVIQRRFKLKSQDGFYGWGGIDYFLFEYEQHLRTSRTDDAPKLKWDEFTSVAKGRTSIEHILPETSTEPYWQQRFRQYNPAQLNRLVQSLGNLLPLSLSINQSLQNIGFDEKKEPYFEEEVKLRSGYREGGFCEIEVSQEPEWTALKIEERGMKMLAFIEERWNVRLGDEALKRKLLGTDFLHGVIIPPQTANFTTS